MPSSRAISPSLAMRSRRERAELGAIILGVAGAWRPQDPGEIADIIEQPAARRARRQKQPSPNRQLILRPIRRPIHR